MNDKAMNAKARYIMIGGFLGAGKSTSVARLAQRLSDDGKRVGLIVNDQGSELVDSVNLRSKGFSVEEITGGCFCCRFNSLVEAADNLNTASRPEIFIAEPVGSCTDLVATVSYPLRRIYGEQYSIAPLSVLVDPARAMRVLGFAEGRSFSEKVVYIYRKQLEEADIIVINKVDSVSAEDRSALRLGLEREFPNAEVMEVSARTGEGLDAWFARILTDEQVGGEAMEVDYEIYAEGEALMGWLNATVALDASEAFDGNAILESFARGLHARLESAGAEVAHLKMTLSPIGGASAQLGEVSAINLVRNDFVPELGQRLGDLITRGELIINLRAEGEPESLRAAVESAIADSARTSGVAHKLDHMEAFKPGKPQPTHRMSSGV